MLVSRSNLTKVSITNNTQVKLSVPPYMIDGEIYVINAGDTLEVMPRSSAELIYLLDKVTNIPGLSVDNSNIPYAATDPVCGTTGVTITKVKEGVYKIDGEIPYEQADSDLGFDAGNRFNFNIPKPSASSATNSAYGVRVTNTLIPSGFNDYTNESLVSGGVYVEMAYSGTRDFFVYIRWDNSKVANEYRFIPGNVTLEEAE